MLIDWALLIPFGSLGLNKSAFIFDAFKRLDNMIVLEVNREEEFAPVKNKEGVDSPQTAIDLYNNFNRRK